MIRDYFFRSKLQLCMKALILLGKHTAKFFQKTLAVQIAPDSLFVLRRYGDGRLKDKTKLTVGAVELVSALQKLEPEMPSRKEVNRHSNFCPLNGETKSSFEHENFEWKHSAAL